MPTVTVTPVKSAELSAADVARLETLDELEIAIELGAREVVVTTGTRRASDADASAITFVASLAHAEGDWTAEAESTESTRDALVQALRVLAANAPEGQLALW